MTRKHFEDLANRLASLREDSKKAYAYETLPHREWELMVNELANFCQSYNSNFKRDKFIEACRTR